MAEEEVAEKEAEEGAEESSEDSSSPKSKKKLLLGGGVAAVVAAGAVAAMVAIPSKDVQRRYAGPFSQSLFEEQFHCNIQEEGRTRFLQMSPVAMFFAYDADYLTKRMRDELYLPELQDTMFQVASRKTLDEIYGEVNESTFMEELKDALDPVLFPIHVGESALPWDVDEESGLRPGLSSQKNTFRGRFDEHVLHVDTANKELWIDDGPKTQYEDGDLDVRLITSGGDVVFIDVSGIKEEFVGEVKIGVQGQIMRILPVGLMVQ